MKYGLTVAQVFQQVSSKLSTETTSTKEERIIINKNKAMKYGLTVAQVFQQVSSKLSTETTSTTLTIDAEDYPVIIVNHDTSNLEELRNIEISGTKGTESVSVKLKDISSIEMADTPTSINHDNQTRYISVTAGIDSKHNIGLVSKEVQSKLDSYKTPREILKLSEQKELSLYL